MRWTRSDLTAGAALLARRAVVEAHAIAMLSRAGAIGIEPPWHAAARMRGLAKYGSVGGPLIHGATRYPDRLALIDERGALSYAELDGRSNALARAWRSAGVGPEATVGILCRNHRGFVDATLASAKLGSRAIFLNYEFSARQLADVCRREGVDLLVHDEEFAGIVGAAAAPLGRLAAWSGRGSAAVAADGSLDALIATTDRAALPPPPRRATLVLLTSGTTGTPRGAPRQQPRSMAAGGALLSRVPFKAGEVTYVAAPMFHALGFLQSQFTLALGSTLVVSRHFEPAGTLAVVAEHRATALVVVPTMLQRLVTLIEQAPAAYDLSALRIVFVSGAQLPAELVRRTQAALGDVVYNLYGSTEVAWATIATPDDLRAAPGCAGRPPYGTKVRLYDGHDHRIERPGVTGRIFVGNVLPFEGYTGGGSKRLVDGLMATGDVGHFDHAGRLFVDGRDDDMIVSGGENVYPGEVEELLITHPAVEEVAVLGVPDAEWGQRLVAFVARRPAATLTADEVKDFVRGRLARYKVPRDVRFLDALPRNPTGKVLKRQLAAEARDV